MLYIVERVVEVEAQLRDYSQLVVYPSAKVVAYRLLVGIDVLEQLLRLLRREDAEIGRADTEVRAYTYTCDTYQYTMSLACLTLKDSRKFLLKESCYSVLSCLLHNYFVSSPGNKCIAGRELLV